jgi:ribonucleoside-diphosphate reductase alpha chain
MAGVVGPFAEYTLNAEPMMRVMQMHRNAIEQIPDAGPRYLKDAAREVWDKVLDAGRKHGFRNAQATVLAPTGTISFMMDCDTTGIEPDIALVKYKQLAGGGMLKIVNGSVPLGLLNLGYTPEQVEEIEKYIDQKDTIEGAPHIKDEHLPVFDCAFTPANGTRSIRWQAHVEMMAAAQPFLSGAISKTVNMPSDTTVKDIADAYYWGWQLGLKAVAIYRDGSKQSQPLSTKSEAKKAEEAQAAKVVEKVVYKPRRERLPDTRNSVTHKFSIAGHEGYINVGLYPDGRPGEVFITMAKEGSTIGGLMDSFGTAISLSLQYGVPLEVLVNKFSHTRFEPNGHTTNPDIRIAKSVVDYIFRWMGLTFMAGYREEQKAKADLISGSESKETSKPVVVAAPVAAAVKTEPIRSEPVRTEAKFVSHEDKTPSWSISSTSLREDSRTEQFSRFQSDAPACDNCGSVTVRNGNCYLCHNCGNSLGCS